MLKYIRIAFLLLISIQNLAQTTEDLKWWDPAKNNFPVIEGQAWQTELKSPYDRLPARAEKLVRAPVWNLSQNNAGEYISFKTDAKKIIIRYAVEGAIQMPHFPATGVSGIDLYSISKDGDWNWAGGKYSFKDTIVYRYDNLEPDLSGYPKGREFRLYLPLYNKIRWLEIGVPSNTSLTPLPLRKEKPIIIYGTSIAQGGCASRPGMAWTSILSRRIDHTVLNLGFSGNGRLEKEVVDMIVEIDAKSYVLDCLPNLTDTVAYPLAEVKRRLIESVSTIRRKHPQVPIILTGYGLLADDMNAAKVKTVSKINEVLHDAIETMKASGIKDIYLQEVKLGIDDMTGGSYRPAVRYRFEAALDASNNLIGYKLRGVGINSGNPCREDNFPSGAVDNLLIDSVEHQSPITTGAWRAPITNFLAFAEQAFIDEVAHAAGKDPIKFRLELLEKAKTKPAGAVKYDIDRTIGVIKLVQEKSGWGTKKGVSQGFSVYFAHRSYVAQVCEVAMKEGKPVVKKIFAAVDCGQVVNLSGARQQVRGGITDGMGHAMYGKLSFKDGAAEQKNFNNYRLIRMKEIPEIEPYFVDNGIEPTGLGEPALPPTGGAVANAIFKATGKRVRNQPFMEEEVFKTPAAKAPASKLKTEKKA